jgi:hypothetical protein
MVTRGSKEPLPTNEAGIGKENKETPVELPFYVLVFIWILCTDSNQFR